MKGIRPKVAFSSLVLRPEFGKMNENANEGLKHCYIGTTPGFILAW